MTPSSGDYGRDLVWFVIGTAIVGAAVLIAKLFCG